MVHGFRLAGVEGYVLPPGKQAWERFERLVQEEDLAILLLSKAVHGAMAEQVDRRRRAHTLPVIMVMPDRGEELDEMTTMELLESYLGVKV